MSLIKIYAPNGDVLDFVKESLTIKRDNNALSRDFSVSHNNRPFLIIDNEKTKRALGTRDLTSVNKVKTIIVTVSEGGQNYYGELQQISYLKGFRKCNLRYATEVLSLMNRKIKEFMPVVSVTGDSTPTPYSETSADLVTGHDQWSEYVQDFITQGFPAVKWQFPLMSYKGLFGDVADENEPWHEYQDKINSFDNSTEDGDISFIENTFEHVDENTVEVSNKNVASPQVYLLTPLFYALQSIGFKIGGAFYESEFIRRILLLSSSNNISDVTLYPENVQDVVFDGSWLDATIDYPFEISKKKEVFAITQSGTYTVFYRFVLHAVAPGSPTNINTSFRARGYIDLGIADAYGDTKVGFDLDTNTEGFVVEGEFDIALAADGEIQLGYYSSSETMPIEYEVYFRKKDSDRIFKMMHPTIDLGRYVPDWTFGAYINALKNFFNLEITIDDFTKKVTIEFNEESISNPANAVINKSLEIVSYDQGTYNAFLLKHENDEDPALWITTDGADAYVAQRSDFSEPLESKFKFVPNNYYTAELSEELDDKDGQGIMIYDHAKAPIISPDYAGQTLKIEGIGGIYDVYWKKFLKFRLNASAVEIEGPFSATEIAKISALKRIYIDHQEYIVVSLEYSESPQGNFILKMPLLSINF